MPAVVVPDLKQKFALLRSYPIYRSWPGLAAAFGRSHKSLQVWQDGKATQDPNRVPDWAVPVLARLIGEALPGDRSDDEIRQFVFGPAALLEEEVRAGAAVSFMAILTQEALKDTATLWRRNSSTNLVEIETADSSPFPRLRLGESFRIAIRRRMRAGYLLALQHAQQVWAVLPAIPSANDPATILVPGLRQDGKELFMAEERDSGRHLFVCLEVPAPAPASVLAARRDETILDKRALDALAAFYLEQTPTQRACHVLTVAFEAPR